MDTRSVVAAFAESPALRATLAVLLEHECRLEFLNATPRGPSPASPPDLAVVAARTPTRLLGELTQRWPRLPIVAIDISGTDPRGLGRSAAPSSPPGIRLVPLEPHAIRTAVLQHLPARPDDALSAMTQAVAEVLQNELRYPFTALRSLSAPPATRAGASTYPILGAIMREQAQVLAEHVADLHTFLARPRAVELSNQFMTELCHQLEHAADGARQPSLLWDRYIDTAAPAALGPVALAPVVARFLWAYVHRRADTAVASVHLNSTTVTITYPLRPSVADQAAAWPFLLARLTLQPWAWRIRARCAHGAETLVLSPAGGTSWQGRRVP